VQQNAFFSISNSTFLQRVNIKVILGWEKIGMYSIIIMMIQYIKIVLSQNVDVLNEGGGGFILLECRWLPTGGG
jgi:hypothetical protein